MHDRNPFDKVLLDTASGECGGTATELESFEIRVADAVLPGGRLLPVAMPSIDRSTIANDDLMICVYTDYGVERSSMQ